MLRPGSLNMSRPLMEKALTALKDMGPHEGAVLLRMSNVKGNADVQVTVLAAGTLTESLIERFTPLIFQEVLKQRLALARAEQAALADQSDDE